MKYRKRPVDRYAVVEAFQWHGEPVEGFERINVGKDEFSAERYNLVVPTPWGVRYAVEGDWIVEVEDGIAELVCSAAVFHATYDPIGPAAVGHLEGVQLGGLAPGDRPLPAGPMGEGI